MNFPPPGFRLANHLIRKVTALSVIECSLQCLRESCCVSTNYKEAVLTNMEENCELNHAAATDQQGDLVKDEGFLHFERLHWNEVSTKSAPPGSMKTNHRIEINHDLVKTCPLFFSMRMSENTPSVRHIDAILASSPGTFDLLATFAGYEG